MGLTRTMITSLLLATLTVFSIAPSSAMATEQERRATVQERFAPKEGRFYVHAAGASLFRNDFYNSMGYGGDVGYFTSEAWGFELRILNLHSWLGRAAQGIREDHSLIPDLRAPDALFVAGTRYSWGYGKVLTMDRFVVHFDPQLILHGGITLAEDRVVPTSTFGFGFLSHWNHGVQIKVDLQMIFQMERRERGWTPSLGFVPMLGIGWSPPGDAR